jgi:hypothetical protein
MDHPTEEKAAGQVDEIDKDAAWLFDIKADHLWQYRRHHGNREGEDQSCLDIIPLCHVAKFFLFFICFWNY